MSLMKTFVENQVFIDFGTEIIYGDDQMNVNYPVRFPIVRFALMGTSGLTEIADRIRKDQGFVPMYPMDEFTDETCDVNGYYDFYVGIYEIDEPKLENCITFFVVNSDSPDNEAEYTIDLSEEEQQIILDQLDEQCQTHLGKSCAELLQEARKEMEDVK